MVHVHPSSHLLSAFVFYTLDQTLFFFIPQKGREKPRGLRANHFGVFNLAEGKGDVTMGALFPPVHTRMDTYTHRACTLRPPSPLSCIVLLIRPCHFSIKHNLYLGGQGLSLSPVLCLCQGVYAPQCVNGSSQQRGTMGGLARDACLSVGTGKEG